MLFLLLQVNAILEIQSINYFLHNVGVWISNVTSCLVLLVFWKCALHETLLWLKKKYIWGSVRLVSTYVATKLNHKPSTKVLNVEVLCSLFLTCLCLNVSKKIHQNCQIPNPNLIWGKQQVCSEACLSIWFVSAMAQNINCQGHDS